METIGNQPQTFEQLIAQTDELIASAESFLKRNGQKYPLDEWLTPAEYVKRFNLRTTNVVSNWIRRGIIPPENILHIPELNDLRLIKAVSYQD